MSDPGITEGRHGEVGPVCKYNQTGFCKFRERCRKRHNNEICEHQYKCENNQCIKRHPKRGRNLKKGMCRHNKNCAYQHCDQENQYDDKNVQQIIINHEKETTLVKSTVNQVK